MLLLYSHTTSSRLQYSCNFVFKELLGIDFSITIDSEEFKNYKGAKINYSNSKILDSDFNIQNHSLLFESNIKEQSVTCFLVNDYKVFFNTPDSDCPFDIFAAVFYLISRYEEYLPHTKDLYGRYGHENSLAFKEGFLQLPLVNIWVKDFAAALKKKFPDLNIAFPVFNFVPTYDIDIAYAYKYKGFVRNIGSFLKLPSLERIRVLARLQKDPFDTYDWLNELHQKNNLHPLYFFLVAEKNNRYDKHILPHKNTMWQLVRQHAKKYTLGIHPSWQSGDTFSLLKKEKGYLEEMSEKKITHSRQHYIRFNLPEDYQRLINSGLTEDYSMGYGSINGFRASVASAFYWYDLSKEEQTDLRLHPFCFMDANSFYEQQYTAAQAYEEMLHYYKACKDVNGTLITIWHNNFLGTDKTFTGWKELYEKFVKKVSSEV